MPFGISNPLKGAMPVTGMKSRGSIVWLVLPLVLGIWLGGQIAAGFVLGTVIVFGLVMTVEQMPGFWSIAQFSWGRLFIAIGTGYITHKIVPGDAITVAVATAWATLLKALILGFESKRLKAEKVKALESAHASIQAYQAKATDVDFVARLSLVNRRRA